MGDSTRRIPQLTDTVHFTLQLPVSTEEWLDGLLERIAGVEVERTAEMLNVYYEVGGNCDAITSATRFFAAVEDALREGNVDPMEFVLFAGSTKKAEREPVPQTRRVAARGVRYGQNLGRTQVLVLRLLAAGEYPKSAAKLAYDWPALTESAARSALGRLGDRRLVDAAGFDGSSRTFALTDAGIALERELLATEGDGA